MSTTSQKHRNFVAEPMGDKPVTDLAGIGTVLGQRLKSKGYDEVGRGFVASIGRDIVRWVERLGDKHCQGYDEVGREAWWQTLLGV